MCQMMMTHRIKLLYLIVVYRIRGFILNNLSTCYILSLHMYSYFPSCGYGYGLIVYEYDRVAYLCLVYSMTE